MVFRDVYLLVTLLGFREISKEQYEKYLAKGYEHSKCTRELCEDRSAKWSVRMCYPKIFSDKEVMEQYYKQCEKYTGIIE